MYDGEELEGKRNERRFPFRVEWGNSDHSEKKSSHFDDSSTDPRSDDWRNREKNDMEVFPFQCVDAQSINER